MLDNIDKLIQYRICKFWHDEILEMDWQQQLEIIYIKLYIKFRKFY